MWMQKSALNLANCLHSEFLIPPPSIMSILSFNDLLSFSKVSFKNVSNLGLYQNRPNSFYHELFQIHALTSPQKREQCSEFGSSTTFTIFNSFCVLSRKYIQILKILGLILNFYNNRYFKRYFKIKAWARGQQSYEVKTRSIMLCFEF